MVSDARPSRADYYRVLAQPCRPHALVVTALGNASYLWAAMHHAPENFYVEDAMGLALPLALGLAVAQPARRVVVVEGDGAIADAYGRSGYRRRGGAGQSHGAAHSERRPCRLRRPGVDQSGPRSCPARPLGRHRPAHRTWRHRKRFAAALGLHLPPTGPQSSFCRPHPTSRWSDRRLHSIRW